MLALTGVALALALSLALQAFGLQRTSMLFFVAVLAAAGWLGVWCGLAAAVAATVAANVSWDGSQLHLAFAGGQDFVNLVVYAVAAWVAGLYMEEGRRGREVVLQIARSMQPPGMARGRFVSPVIRFLYRPFVVEAVRMAAAFCLSVATAGLGSLVAEGMGALPVSMLYLAGVTLSGSLLGARYALITAVASTAFYDYLVAGPRFTFALNTATAGLNLVVFLAVGWRVGLFTDRVRYEREVVRRLLNASRRFSGAADEGELQQLVAEGISAATGGGYAAVWDAEGRLAVERGATSVGEAPPPPPPDPLDGTQVHGAWRMRRLTGEAGPLGSVAWVVDQGDDDRPVQAIINILIDLAAAAMARARLSTERAELQAAADAERLRRALLASLSHDVRTPLAGILGSATSLLDNSDKFAEAVRSDLLSNIRDQAYRLDRYLENLLGMTRLEAGALQAQPQAVPLEPLVYETWEAIAGAAGMRRPNFHVDPEVMVLADPVLLRQAFGNVLENAIKFSPEGAPVEVLSAPRADAVALAVEDHGPGVASTDLEKMFQPFFRAGRSGKPGVGLGLFIARSFVQAMGAEVRAMKREDGGDGLRVEFVLQLAPRAS